MDRILKQIKRLPTSLKTTLSALICVAVLGAAVATNCLVHLPNTYAICILQICSFLTLIFGILTWLMILFLTTGSEGLSFAAEYGLDMVVKMILEYEMIPVNEENIAGETLLHLAAFYNHERMVKLLLKREDIEVNATDHFGDTPLFLAAHNGHDKVLKILLRQEGIEVNRATLLGETPLSAAADHRHGKVVNLLLGTDEIRAIGWDGWRPIAEPG